MTWIAFGSRTGHVTISCGHELDELQYMNG
jgi:hypothetical protein